MQILGDNQWINTRLLPLSIIVIICVFTFYTPYQLIGNDSVSGFEAMTGYNWTHKFNTLLFYNPSSHHLEEHFLTWWSPGQYSVPQFFMETGHISIGTAVTMVNSICVFLGTMGYWLVFKKYGFNKITLWISVIFILFSSPILHAYFLYVGGESLNFMIFPWILLLQKQFVHKYLNFLLPGAILMISFIAKLQMLIIVPPLIFVLVAENDAGLNFIFTRERRLKISDLNKIFRVFIPFLISISVAILFIYLDFISKGITPAHATHPFSIRVMAFLVPLASPLTSLSFFDSVFSYLNGHIVLQSLYLLVISVIVVTGIVFLVRSRTSEGILRRKYMTTVLFLFFVSVLIFAVLYSSGSDIDYNTRHFKLSAYLMYPIVVERLMVILNKRLFFSILAFLLLFAAGNHLRLTKKWLSGTSVTSSGFRLSHVDVPLLVKEKLDKEIKTKMVVVSRYQPRYAIDNPFILPVSSSGFLLADTNKLGYPVILLDSLR